MKYNKIEMEQPGLEKFSKRFIKEHPQVEIGVPLPEAKERIRVSLERIKKEIEASEPLKSEATIHHYSTTDLSTISNFLAQAIQIALENSVEEALKFVLSIKDPYLIDLFHDILIEHFLETLVTNGKIKIIK
ncbi:MAG: hypothetical protein C4278_00795 [Patescibacteria group bacterium]